MRRIRHLFTSWGLGWLLLGVLAGAGQVAAQDPAATDEAATPDQPVASYSIAIAPLVPAGEIKRRWQPLADYLSQSTGLEFHLRFYDGAERFDEALSRSEPDFVIVGPQQVWSFRDHYRPLLRDTDPQRGVVVVLRSSHTRQLSDLQGQQIAIPEGHDVSSRDLVLLALNRRHVRVEPVVMHTHSNGFRALYLGKVEAASGNNMSLELVEPEIRAQLRVIYRSRPLPPPALAVRRGVPEEHARQVHDALLRLHESNPRLLADALMAHFTDADLDRDYGALAKMPAAEAASHAP